MLMHTYNPSSWESDGGRLQHLGSVWATQLDPVVGFVLFCKKESTS